MNARPQKYISIFNAIQAGLKALQVTKTPSQSLQRSQTPLKDICTHQSVVLFCVPDILGYVEKTAPISLQGCGHRFV
jgi:hypothetical protein